MSAQTVIGFRTGGRPAVRVQAEHNTVLYWYEVAPKLKKAARRAAIPPYHRGRVAHPLSLHSSEHAHGVPLLQNKRCVHLSRITRAKEQTHRRTTTERLLVPCELS